MDILVNDLIVSIVMIFIVIIILVVIIVIVALVLVGGGTIVFSIGLISVLIDTLNHQPDHKPKSTCLLTR